MQSDYWIGRFFNAARNGNVRVLEERLNAGTNIDMMDNSGANALNIASAKGHAHAVSFLLARGADPNFNSPQGTPLSRAIQCAHFDILEQLLAFGADPSLPFSRNGSKETPLALAAEFGRFEAASALLEKGANPNGADKQGLTPLHAACQNSRPRFVPLLLTFGADPNSEDEGGRTPLCFAAENGLSDIVDALLEAGAKAKISGNSAGLPWLKAFLRGHFEVAEKLGFEEGIPLLKHPGNIFLSLCGSGVLKGVQIMLERGCDINAKNDIHVSGMVAAAERHHNSLVEFLFLQGADASAERNGKTAASVAFETRNNRLVSFFARHLERFGETDQKRLRAVRVKAALRQKTI